MESIEINHQKVDKASFSDCIGKLNRKLIKSGDLKIGDFSIRLTKTQLMGESI